MAVVDRLGSGIKYPLQLVGGSIQLTDGKSLIKQSIYTILSTPKGSRFFLPEYGSRIRELMFEPNDTILEDLLRVFIYEAISKWEKRARYISVDFTRDIEAVYCNIRYSVVDSTDIDSFIYPFYTKLVH